MAKKSKRIPHAGLTSPHSITVPDVTHEIVEAASQATGYSSAALYSLGGELVAALLTYDGKADQNQKLVELGDKLAKLPEDNRAVWWALEALREGAYLPL